MTGETVENWYQRVAAAAIGRDLVTVHVDELLPTEFERDPLDASLSAFSTLARCVETANTEQIVLLVIAIRPLMRLRKAPPSVLRASWLRESPPALYVSGPDLWSVWDDEEEYRVPVQPEWFSLSCGRVHYRVHRDKRSREHGWEYDRSFYIHAGRSNG